MLIPPPQIWHQTLDRYATVSARGNKKPVDRLTSKLSGNPKLESAIHINYPYFRSGAETWRHRSGPTRPDRFTWQPGRAASIEDYSWQYSTRDVWIVTDWHNTLLWMESYWWQAILDRDVKTTHCIAMSYEGCIKVAMTQLDGNFLPPFSVGFALSPSDQDWSHQHCQSFPIITLVFTIPCLAIKDDDQIQSLSTGPTAMRGRLIFTGH
jgi:hypothetical protein